METNILQPGANRVTFQSEGETLVGVLYLPVTYQPGDKLPAIIVTGSWTTVKEQMAGLYAHKLAEQGYAALAFDFRYFGESGGIPRNYESPAAKIVDIQNAVSYLQTVDAVDSQRIGGLGICASAGYMAVAVAQDPRIQSFVAVAPWIHDRHLVEMIYGGMAGVEAKLEAGRAARHEFEQTGVVETVPAISTTDENAAMFGEFDYYLNPERGAIPQWGNQFAVMSWVDWLTFSPMPQASQINVPTLFIHSRDGAVPAGAEQFFADIPAPKQFVWMPGIQFDFYDQEPTVNQAVQTAVEHLKQTL
ncbi:alpha/beta hydrolase [Leptolyngbya sp. NK1-12]|uniref:Alpha/beta hydrolase n=1 Tax=Leptolyngbya sp. NK1-12 TaxID=2547451 RepID=A0AA96WSX5_9CYAN|nr:alpha/beta hydrolase [Leptolyngbya sp. NK1-12]WNZ22227.1 alpha/beta hydrolase [Leptolyngbya sp. NK1-12]